MFVSITFLRSVFIAMLKFFLRSYLKEANISLEQIAGFLSLWGMIAYLVWWSISYVFRKKNITLFAGLLAIVCLIVGNILGYYPFRVFVLLISTIGFSYSLRLVIKSIILSAEIQRSKNGEVKINGIINITILTGILLGSYLWFAIFNKRWANGFHAIIGILVTSSVLTMLMNYDEQFVSKKLNTTVKKTFPNIRWIIKKYIRLLLPIGSLRAISTAIGQKMLEIGIDYFNRTTTSSIVIIVISFVWAIIGHMISVIFKKRKTLIAMIFTIIFGISTIYFPHIINKYEYFITLNIFWFFIGMFFGVAVNLLEGRYFFYIWDDHRKEYGSVTYWIVTSSIIFIIMIITDYFSSKIWTTISFFFFGFVLLLMPFCIKKFDTNKLKNTKKTTQ